MASETEASVASVQDITEAAVETAPVHQSTSEEPQNALTKQFTEAEWAALKEFKTKLPEIWREAYSSGDKDELKLINLWGVDIDPSSPATDARVSVVLMKFLRARELNVADAQTMLAATLKWREEFKVADILEEKFPEDVFGGVGRVYGHDNDGRPVTYNLYGGTVDIKAVFGDPKRFIRWRVQLMEKTIRLLDFEKYDQMVQIHDYDGVSLFAGRDANQKAAASEATSIFQSYYPEFLARKFFVNVPGVLTWIYWFFKSVLSAKTFAKMSVVGSGTSTLGAALLPVIPADQLPKRYGGEAEAF